MSTILVTGGSGFIGGALAAALKTAGHDVVCIGRHKPVADVGFVKGDFTAFEDLIRLDGWRFDAAVHLAAVTGGCSERDGILVNVEGSRTLMRYLLDRGCRKLVMASSIAAVGFQSVRFRPVALPVTEEHPCLDRDGYGFSKFLMEQVTRYYARQHDDLDVLNLRLASIYDEARPGAFYQPRPVHAWALGAATQMSRKECVRLLILAVASPRRPGCRVMNAVAPRVYAARPVPELLCAWYPELSLDLSFYERPGQEMASLFDASRVREAFGFVAEA